MRRNRRELAAITLRLIAAPAVTSTSLPVQAAPGRSQLGQVVAPQNDARWAELQSLPWFEEGSSKANQIVYVFSDPNCMWCHKLWDASRPWVQGGKVRIRYLLVAIVREDSGSKAAAILTDRAPVDAMARNERTFDAGGIQGLKHLSFDVKRKLDLNLAALRKLGFRGTPAMVYRSADGEVKLVAGYRRNGDLSDIFGPLQ